MRSYVGVSYRLGRLTEARAWCERLVELAPHDSQARELLAALKAADATEP